MTSPLEQCAAALREEIARLKEELTKWEIWQRAEGQLAEYEAALARLREISTYDKEECNAAMDAAAHWQQRVEKAEAALAEADAVIAWDKLCAEMGARDFTKEEEQYFLKIGRGEGLETLRQEAIERHRARQPK